MNREIPFIVEERDIEGMVHLKTEPGLYDEDEPDAIDAAIQALEEYKETKWYNR